MVLELAGREPFRLGHAMIDPVPREARWDGGEERLQPQTLKVLIALAAKRGEVVTRDELIELCWGGRIVGDDVINRSVSLARHLAARAGGFSIQTVPRAGYRLIENGQANRTTRRKRIAIAGFIAVTLAAIVSAILFTRPGTNSPALSVAIQHFDFDKGDDASRRLAAQAEDSSVRMLTESGVSVEIADSDGKPGPPPDFLLSGAISGNGAQAVATIRLDDPRRHKIVLSRQIHANAADPAALPDQVGANVAAALSRAEWVIRLDRVHPSDSAFVASLLSSNSSNFDSKREFEFARQKALLAPDSAIAQMAIAISTGMNLFELPIADRPAVLAVGQQAAARAIRLAPNFGDSQVQWCMLHAEVRIAECESRLRAGIAADPAADAAPSILSHLLLNVGRIDEAVSVASYSLAKDPYVPSKIAGLLNAIEVAGHSQEADTLYRRGHRLWPDYRGLLLDRVSGTLARGDFDALSEFEGQLGPDELPDDYPSLARPLARAIRARSLPLARESCGKMTDDDLPVIECMLALSRLGDFDATFRLADGLYPPRTGRTAAEEQALWLADPDSMDTMYLAGAGAAALRTDPRFLELAERVGLLRYWRRNGLPDFCTKMREPVCSKIAR